jgi:anti-sigma regulatory factor (Ser/Thr protein kinase)
VDPRHVIDEILRTQGEVRTAQVAARTGRTRQAIHKHLAAMVREGVLRREGQGRASRYLPPRDGAWHWTHELDGLEEGVVWRDLQQTCPALKDIAGEAYSTLIYAFSELLNNAIDHSGSASVRIEVSRAERLVVFDILDTGVGALPSIAAGLDLPDTLSALQELSKGKVTTAPTHHPGEGIFFTSKAGARFELESGGWTWTVDNTRSDFTVGPGSTVGTRVRFELLLDQVTPLQTIFERYTTDFVFNKTRTHVRLFELGVDFVSRSEARRLTHGLDRFDEVVLDFSGVTRVGQGFADQVFRVWATAHPIVVLLAVHMTDAVAFMVERARHRPD